MGLLKRAPPAPKSLSPEAAAFWGRLLPACVKLRSVRSEDLQTFELMCIALSTEREARRRLDQEGMTVPSGAGTAKGHPCLRVAETARAQALTLLGQFGLTPVALQAAPEWKDDP